MHVGNYFPSLVAKYGDQIFVFDGVKEPEEYGAQVPPFNTPDPSYTTTTSTTTTTTTHHAPARRRRHRRTAASAAYPAADAGGHDHTDHGAVRAAGPGRPAPRRPDGRPNQPASAAAADRWLAAQPGDRERGDVAERRGEHGHVVGARVHRAGGASTPAAQ